MQESYFDGSLLELVAHCILATLAVVLTFGLASPWASCMLYRWKAEHTVIEGRRLQFHGKAMDLFVQWIVWAILCVITLGIYSFWVGIALEKWKVKNTSFMTV